MPETGGFRRHQRGASYRLWFSADEACRGSVRQQATTDFPLTSLKGTRDGERLAVQAVSGAGSQRLTVDLEFRVTPQAKLQRGTWSGLVGEGGVRERSVTFLGGQSGPPSVGGRFDLIGPGDRAMYRVSIPLQPLNDTL